MTIVVLLVLWGLIVFAYTMLVAFGLLRRGPRRPGAGLRRPRGSRHPGPPSPRVPLWRSSRFLARPELAQALPLPAEREVLRGRAVSGAGSGAGPRGLGAGGRPCPPRPARRRGRRRPVRLSRSRAREADS